MNLRADKSGCFLLTALHAFGTTYFFQYILFTLRQEHGFTPASSLLFCALHGLVYTISSLQGGRYAQRKGCTRSIAIGLAGMSASLFAGLWLKTGVGVTTLMVMWSIFMCFTWPAIEAIAGDEPDRASVAQSIGIYNLTWSASACLAYFTGGALIDLLGPQSLFYVPASIHLFSLLLLPQLLSADAGKCSPQQVEDGPEPEAFRQPVSPRAFMKMAWLANPFAYIAINTLPAAVPFLSTQMGFDKVQSGYFWATWFFVRLATFALLWRWTGWHYRFRWLLAAFVGLTGSLAVMLLSHEFWLLLAAQAVFGLSTGLLYSSSLFYAMDNGDEKSKHGGLHEALIGIGICLGPAAGVAGIAIGNQSSAAAAWPVSASLAVVGLLIIGLLGLLWLRLRGAQR